ncbi:MAG: hypothetical protein KKF20_05035 [Bacteroidetes bacterium]|nr:hypothetical protein [Bacteroidota bacterium]
MDYLKIYDLENYLFEVVSPAFAKNGKLNAFDFFCIVIWKANRAKSKVALKLLAKDKKNRRDLGQIVEELTGQIHCAKDSKERMRILVEDWGFRLPMASAILTVLYPTEFTVYDVRVCNILGNHHSAQNKSRFDDVWKGYTALAGDVRAKVPDIDNLRDKDRFL